MDDNNRNLVGNVMLASAMYIQQIVTLLATLAADVVGDLEDDFYNGLAWHRVDINLDDFLQMGDPSFQLHFRLCRSTFEALLEVIGNHLVALNRLQRERTPLPIILMMVLWILATGDTFRSVALQFRTRPGTVHYHYLYVIEALRELAPHYIQWPNREARTVIKAAFEEANGFPGVVGCIDGTHIKIVAPRVGAAQYVNRHHTYSMNVQCVCDHRLLITDLYVGEVGSVHDSRIFRRSPLCDSLLQNGNALDFDEHILGDGGYILLNSVITPFRNNGHLTAQQRNYNRLLSQLRVCIENCFARLKNMWRRLKCLYAAHSEIVIDHIIASAVLHNFIILNGHELDMADMPVINENNPESEEEDEDFDDDVGEYPNVPAEPDHPLLEDAKELGAEKRLHIMTVLPRTFA